MKIYKVGGAVRDHLLGHPIHDIDWVVVGASPQDLLNRGFASVGKDFPVFLHPETHEEYALARTERKTGPGYHGFSFYAAKDVTLEQDLARRDLTINAIAEDEKGHLIDPFHGKKDLQAGVLRHVSEAFAEDPVRILRTARFAARYSFSVAPETMVLMREMVDRGEVNALVVERVWQEIAKGLMEEKPSTMFAVLRDCGALAVLMPEVDALFGVLQHPDKHPEVDVASHVMHSIDLAALENVPLPVRFSILCHDLGKPVTFKDSGNHHKGHNIAGKEPLLMLCNKFKVPNDCKELAMLTVLYHIRLHKLGAASAEDVMDLFQRTDAFRRSERFALFLQACSFDARGRPGYEGIVYHQAQWAKSLLHSVMQVDCGKIALNVDNKLHVAEVIFRARLLAIKDAMSKLGIRRDHRVGSCSVS